MSFLMPLGPDLVAHNLRITAARMGWPDGAVEACEQINAENPGWHTGYHIEAPAGWYAWHDNHYHLEPSEYGATPDELRARIRGHRCGRMT